MNLFKHQSFTSHSGLELEWKINCDALTDEDIECLAYIISTKFPHFGEVVGVPTGGLRIAAAMAGYVTRKIGLPTLIVDDVLTTGRSMNEMREKYPGAVGAVIFARGPCPHWVYAVFELGG